MYNSTYIYLFLLVIFVYFFIDIQQLLRTIFVLSLVLLYIFFNWFLVYQFVLKKTFVGEVIREMFGIKHS